MRPRNAAVFARTPSSRVVQWEKAVAPSSTAQQESCVTMSTDTITIHLPGGLYRRLARLADLTKQPLEGLIVQTLSSSLPPLPDDLPPATRDALQALEALSDDELWQRARATFPEEQYARLTALRERRRDGALPTDEQAELDQLLEAADLLTLQKAYGAVLLKWRGYRLPPVSALSEARA